MNSFYLLLFATAAVVASAAVAAMAWDLVTAADRFALWNRFFTGVLTQSEVVVHEALGLEMFEAHYEVVSDSRGRWRLVLRPGRAPPRCWHCLPAPNASFYGVYTHGGPAGFGYAWAPQNVTNGLRTIPPLVHGDTVISFALLCRKTTAAKVVDVEGEVATVQTPQGPRQFRIRHRVVLC